MFDKLFRRKKILRVGEVYRPGGLPVATYVDRSEHGLEDKLRDALDRGHVIVAVSGPTKSGKTVLCRSVIPDANSIWIASGAVKTPDDFWLQLATQLGAATSIVKGTSTTANGAVRFGPASGPGAEFGGSRGTHEIAHRESHLPSDLPRRMIERGLTLVIDDFHYIPVETQKELLRSFRPHLLDGLPIVIISVAHKVWEPLGVEYELTGRFVAIRIPEWTTDELVQIATAGFDPLNVEWSSELSALFAEEAIGSPLLMQDFSMQTCFAAGVRETVRGPRQDITAAFDQSKVFPEVAERTGHTVYDALRAGPRTAIRKPRQFAGRDAQADIYGVVLAALSELRAPKTVMLPELRRKINELIVVDDQPHPSELNNALDQLRKIAAARTDVEPALDWDSSKRTLHLTDPYLRFFMRWGAPIQ